MPAAKKAALNYDPRVDAYINKSAPFAQPILAHIRQLVHQTLPDVEETIKWSHAFFMYRGLILGNMAAFKQHASFGLWGEEIAKKLSKGENSPGGAMGTFGRITTLADLPPDKKIQSFLREAAAVLDNGTRTRNYSRPQRVAKPPAVIPPDFAAALKKNKPAQKFFDTLAPGQRREYLDWITGAKREETTTKRIAQAVSQLAEGKKLNWKYENC